MNECMHGLTVVCVCVCVCVCGWVVRSTCLQGGAVYIVSGKGTFTTCNFTSNEAKAVSLEEEHADISETYMIYSHTLNMPFLDAVWWRDIRYQWRHSHHR